MRIRTLVWRESFERRRQLIASVLAVLLGVAAIVAIKNITFYSEKAVARELDALGTNILVLPKSATVQDYYTADMSGGEIPEEYLNRLVLSKLEGLDNLSPKLSVPVRVDGKAFTLTGILPKSEFQAKAAWGSVGIFSRPAGCGDVGDAAAEPPPKETSTRRRVIKTLGPNEALVGSDVAASLEAKVQGTLQLFDRPFVISAILPETGTVDDSRIFAHLHTVQKLTGKDSVLNAIEVVGCCKEISGGLVKGINDLLPNARVVTIKQVVDTQVKTNETMTRLSLLFIAVICLVGGASIANYMYANVYERRREIGTFMALGASSSLVLRIFMLKALLLGLVGGVGGYALGTVLAVALGPRLAGIPVLPIPMLALWGIGLSLVIVLVASYFPARRAARLDPCTTLQEV